MSYAAPTATEIAKRRAELAPFDSDNERTWLALFAMICASSGLPGSYLDLGSGTGAMVNMARRCGVDAIGIDVINGPEDHFVTHDLTRPLDLGRTFDLITCLEVAEHLPEDAAETLCATIARHMHRGSMLVFSAAPPGQGGEHHVNLKSAVWWRSRLAENGVSYRREYTAVLSHLWGWIGCPAGNWLCANLQVFDR